MPNGGVPMHMVIEPDGASLVIHCAGPFVRVIDAREWDERKGDAEPLATLPPEQALALSRFLRYWLEDTGDGPIYDQPGTAFDF
jgi:hypothetical protein